MKLEFSKIKASSQLFFQRTNNIVEQHNDKFIIRSFPFFSFSGTYFIKSLHIDNFAFTVYKTVRSLDGEKPDMEDNSRLREFGIYPDEWFVYITKSGRKIKLYDKNNEGVILKR